MGCTQGCRRVLVCTRNGEMLKQHGEGDFRIARKEPSLQRFATPVCVHVVVMICRLQAAILLGDFRQTYELSYYVL